MKPRIIWMMIGGLAIALALFLIVQYAGNRAAQTGGQPTPIETGEPPEQRGLTPISFINVSEFMGNSGTMMRLTGAAEPGSIVVLRNRGERLRQIKVNDAGEWALTLSSEGQAMVIEAEMLAGEGTIDMRAEETIFRIPVPKSPDVAAAEFISPALIMVSAPGSPSRIVQSPFGGSPTNGPLTMGAVDYDDTGGVIFSGTTAQSGRIRLYAGNAAIGETRIGAEGRWNFIAGNMLPFGEYIIRAELIQPGRERIGISVPFERLQPLKVPDDNEGALSVKYEPYRWQLRRTLIGGGTQSTVIFAPDVRIPDEALNEVNEESGEELKTAEP